MKRRGPEEDDGTYLEALDGLIRRGLVLETGDGLLAPGPRVRRITRLPGGGGIVLLRAEPPPSPRFPERTESD